MNKCFDCSDIFFEQLNYDPRDPPIFTDLALCNDCCYIACDEAVQKLEEEINEIKQTQANL